jgi:hypothetical protein
MAQPSPLNSSLIRKGEAKAVSPEVAAGVAPSPAQAMSSPSAPASAVGAAPAPAPPQPDTQPLADPDSDFTDPTRVIPRTLPTKLIV